MNLSFTPEAYAERILTWNIFTLISPLFGMC